MPKQKPHPSAESRRKNERVYVLLDKSLRDQLKLVASARGMQFVELLSAMAEREIKAWERLSGITVSDLLAAGQGLKKSEPEEPKPKPKPKPGVKR
jgi:hypothetical protein